MKLDQEELQRKSEQLKEQKIKQIKNDIRTSCSILFEFPKEIENIIISYSFDESTIETNTSLKKKVKEYCNTDKEYLISKLDVSCVTSMNDLFAIVVEHDPNSLMGSYSFIRSYFPNNFNQSLDKWDTSNVVDMHNMFHFCTHFNQPVILNTKNVVDMSGMFSFCKEFNQPVEFNTSNVINMYCMFLDCSSFNQPVNFDTKNVTDMGNLFRFCHEFNQPVNFDTKNVTNMVVMFHDCYNFNQPVNFDTSNVINMGSMFYNCKKFNQVVNFDTSKVLNVYNMFKNCESLEEKNKLLVMPY